MMLALQRSWDDLLLPVYDVMSHRNNPYLNTECNSVHDHWDNDKVQWWYGDAAKSLMMLPEDYF